MKLWPDWNSIESVKRAETFYFWTGWGFFLLLVGFEAVARVYQIRKDTLVEIRDERISEQMQREASDAQKTHEAEIGRLRSKAEAANDLAAKAEYDAAPRRISLLQQAKIFAALSKHRGQKYFQFWQPPNVFSTFEFGDDLRQMLSVCEWAYSVPTVSYPSGIDQNSNTPGIIISTSPSPDKESEAAADDFCKIFRVTARLTRADQLRL
jgi:hypothetical protein